MRSARGRLPGICTLRSNSISQYKRIKAWISYVAGSSTWHILVDKHWSCTISIQKMFWQNTLEVFAFLWSWNTTSITCIGHYWTASTPHMRGGLNLWLSPAKTIELLHPNLLHWLLIIRIYFLQPLQFLSLTFTASATAAFPSTEYHKHFITNFHQRAESNWSESNWDGKSFKQHTNFWFQQ